jgi:hypothetical protein
MTASLGCIAISTGLSFRFNQATSDSMVVGLLVLLGFGAGLSTFHFAQYRVTWSDLFNYRTTEVDDETFDELDSGWHNLAIFVEMLGGSIGIAASQAVFMSRLIKLSTDAKIGTFNMGATTYKTKLSDMDLAKALRIRNDALTKSFLVATAAGALPFAVPVVMLLMLVWLSWFRRFGRTPAPGPSASTKPEKISGHDSGKATALSPANKLFTPDDPEKAVHGGSQSRK